jgi:CRISP-associated protein Cas1
MARTVDDLFPIEAQAALDYWANWNFELKHKKRNWPAQWTLFSYRASPVSGGPRHATHPVNAMLNYAYAVAAAQITRTLQAAGFDSMAGFMHADDNGRHSLAYDLLELLRADVDSSILAWVAGHIWKRPDFPVTPEGLVRLQPTLAAVVAQKAILSEKVVDGAVEWLENSLSTSHHNFHKL